MSDSQIISAVDDQGNFLRYISKEEGHAGEGIHHLAITVFVFNYKGEVLLKKRKHKVFDNIWDNTASTHQLHLEDHDETDEEATLRALKREYRIKNIELRNLGGFNYCQRIGELCENEHCAILVGTYDGKLDLNPEVGYGYKWMDRKKFLEDIEKDPDQYTAWAKEAVKVLKKSGFFND